MTDPADVRLPSIDGLRAFEAAARLGTFERAADELAITASAVSKRVSTVEELIGSALFSRTGKSLALTAAGREYLEQVRQALSLLTAMPQHRRAVQRVQRLRVVTPPTFARQILVPELEAFTRSHPEVELEVVLSMPFLDSQVPEAEVEVRHGDPRLLGGQVLMNDVVLPLASPALLLRQPELRTLNGLARGPLLRTPIEPWTPWLRAAGLDVLNRRPGRAWWTSASRWRPRSPAKAWRSDGPAWHGRGCAVVRWSRCRRCRCGRRRSTSCWSTTAATLRRPSPHGWRSPAGASRRSRRRSFPAAPENLSGACRRGLASIRDRGDKPP